MNIFAQIIAKELQLPQEGVENTLKLLDDCCTIPFISRYRKERTGGLDEIQIAKISDLGERLKEMQKRKETIVKTITDQGRMTDELQQRIDATWNPTELEDIYLPFKPKRRTRAQVAREHGLEPLAEILLMQREQNPQKVAERFVRGEVKDVERALQGAKDIIAEIVSEDEISRQQVRQQFRRDAVIRSKVVAKKKETDEAAKYYDYFDFEEPLRRCSSHRLLAMRRGETEGILRVSITTNDEQCIERLERHYLRGYDSCRQKIRQLEKIVPIEIDEKDNSALHLKFPPCLRSGDYPIICDEVGKSYGEYQVFTNVNITIKRGEKVAFVGKNGEGKSTLVKCIMNEIPYDGMLKIGHNVQIGYFAQNQAQLLDDSLTVFETIDRVARGDIRLRINDILGAFMFGGEESDKRVKVLSGGERSRLAMIKLLLEPVNLLILDEPTNHLDMPSKDVLKEAIKAFDGTAIIVSHDREFLDGLVCKVYEFGGGKVKKHLGGIYDWIKSPVQAIRMNDEASIENKKDTPTKENQKQGSTASMSYQDRKEMMKRISRLQKSIKETEAKIEKIEGRMNELDKILCTPEGASDMTVVTEYTSTKKLLDNETERWEQLSIELEEIQNEINI